jgi:hypothetical protein
LAIPVVADRAPQSMTLFRRQNARVRGRSGSGNITFSKAIDTIPIDGEIMSG